MQQPQKRTIGLAFLIGLLLAASWFGACYWLSRLPVISVVSLSLAFRPWWRHWQIAALLLFLPGSLTAMAHFSITALNRLHAESEFRDE